MKTISKYLLCAALCGGASATAQVLHYGVYNNTNQAVAARQAEDRQSQQFTHSRELLGADVKDPQGKDLGKLEDLLINPQTGEVLASIGLEEDRHAIVPVQALKMSRPSGIIRSAQVTLDKTKEALLAGPTLAKDQWRQLDDPTFTRNIYRHYNVESPASGMGGTGSDSMNGTSEGPDSDSKGRKAGEKSVTPLPTPQNDQD